MKYVGRTKFRLYFSALAGGGGGGGCELEALTALFPRKEPQVAWQ